MKSVKFLFPTLLTLAVLILCFVHLVNSLNGNVLPYTYALDIKNLTEFNFIAVGDWGCGSETKKMVKNMIDEDPELILGLGDYSYVKNVNCWLDLVNPIDNRMKIAIGNHDTDQTVDKSQNELDERLQKYMDHFSFHKQFYSFNYQNIHFLAMSTEVPFKENSEQYKYVVADLQLTSKNPTTDWLIVYVHKPFYSSPNSGHSSVAREMISLRDTYHPLFDKYEVDLILQGHVHNYQRTFPLNFNNSNSLKPIITGHYENNYNQSEGPIFTIVGTGGIASRGVPYFHSFADAPADYMAVQFQAIGFLNLHVSHNGTLLVGEFQSNDGIIMDRFTMNKLNNNNKK